MSFGTSASLPSDSLYCSSESDQQEPSDDETDLLCEDDGIQGTPSLSSATGHNLRTAPVITGDALRLLGTEIFPQRAIYGRVISQHGSGLLPIIPTDREVLINVNAPFSAVVCGVQVYTSSVLVGDGG